MKRFLILSLATLALSAGCTRAPSDAPRDAVAPTAAESQAEQLDRLFDEYWEAALELNPLRATFIGDHRYNDRFPVSISPDHIAATRALLERSLAAVEAVPPETLDEQRRLSQERFIRDMRHSLAGYRFPSELLPVSQFFSMPNRFAMLGLGTSAQPFQTVTDYENFLQRMDGFVAWVDQAIVNMRQGMETGVVQPAILMERTIPQLEAHIVDAPGDSLFFRPVAELPRRGPGGRARAPA